MAKKLPNHFKAIVDCPGEYDALVSFVQEINGFTSLREDIEKAKNNKRGDFQANYAYYCLHRLGIYPLSLWQ